MAEPRFLTKSRFKLAAECPTKLFYSDKETVYRNLKQEDSFLAMLADGGYQVGELAKLIYPKGIEVTAIDHVQAVQETKELLKKEKVTLFDPAIVYGDFFVRIDILVKDGDKFKIIEVKAKSYNSDDPKILGSKGSILSKMRPYIEDVAFQAFVFKAAYPSAKVSSFLMMPDKSVKAKISGLNQLFKLERVGKKSKVVTSPKAKTMSIDPKLLALVPVDDFVEKVYKAGVQYIRYNEPFDLAASKWAKAYKENIKIKPDPGSQCGKCEFKNTNNDGFKSGFKECWSQIYGFREKDFEEGTVLDLYNYSKKDVLISDGRVRLSSLTENDINLKDKGEVLSISGRQWIQAFGIPSNEDRGGYWISETFMRKEIEKWKFPYHFIDFETSTVAIPFHAEMRPYEIVAFQFSHHLMNQDGSFNHVGEFLCTDPVIFPNFEFVRALKKELDQDQGTVFMWSSHENTVLNKIKDQLEDTDNPPNDALELIDFIQTLTKGGDREMYDLCTLSKDSYYQKDTKGSSSIKKVLPAVLKTSTWLKDKYSQPIYGSQQGIKSLNYSNFSWWIDNGAGVPKEPYDLLKNYGADLLGEELYEGEDPDELAIAEGGAAATAYARLQFEDLDPSKRSSIENALLRYCELDTLAMVMIVQAWKDFLGFKDELL